MGGGDEEVRCAEKVGCAEEEAFLLIEIYKTLILAILSSSELSIEHVNNLIILFISV